MIKKSLGFPSLPFGLIQSPHNVVLESDTYESDTPYVVLTEKLHNSAYHVNDLPSAVTTDSTAVTTQRVQDSPLSLTSRLVRDLTLEVAHLTRIIKTSQARKDILTSLISNLQRNSTAVHGASDAAADTSVVNENEDDMIVGTADFPPHV